MSPPLPSITLPPAITTRSSGTAFRTWATARSSTSYPLSGCNRPTVTTEDPTLVLAGDLTRIDLPVALMERAATTGFYAANALLTEWDVRGHDLWTVANSGRSALLRRAAGRSRSRSAP